MGRHDRTTEKQIRVPTVLVVGASDELVAVVDEAALAAQVLVNPCPVADVTTVAAEVRPLVIVVPDEVLSFDPDSFYDLARDTGSRLLAVRQGEIYASRVKRELTALIAEAEEADLGSSALRPDDLP